VIKNQRQSDISALLDLHSEQAAQVVVKLYPPFVGPTQPAKLPGCRCNKLDCIECWNAGVRFADYRQAKKLEGL
jgi:hypothetical protein